MRAAPLSPLKTGRRQAKVDADVLCWQGNLQGTQYTPTTHISLCECVCARLCGCRMARPLVVHKHCVRSLSGILPISIRALTMCVRAHAHAHARVCVCVHVYLHRLSRIWPISMQTLTRKNPSLNFSRSLKYKFRLYTLSLARAVSPSLSQCPSPLSFCLSNAQCIHAHNHRRFRCSRNTSRRKTPCASGT